MPGELRFEFGRNWANFLSVLNDDRIERAQASLKSSLRLLNLNGKTFVDIGCGSGLFSLAAARLGATVHSFDADPYSVKCTTEVKRRYFPDCDRWSIEQGSVLDESYLAGLGSFDIVYSWGVLHHTGDMWKALANIIPLVEPDGQLYLAIYNDMGSLTRRWRAIKKRYVASGPFGKWAILLGVVFGLTLRESAVRLLRMENPFPIKEWREYKQKRGMAPWYDYVDWIGGYPYEAARPEEIFMFYRERGFILEYMTTGGLGCNEFIFSKAPLREVVFTSKPLAEVYS